MSAHKSTAKQDGAAMFAPVAPPETAKMKSSIQNIQIELRKVNTWHDSLIKLTEQSGGTTTEGAVAEQLKEFRNKIQKADKEDEKAIEVIKDLLDDVLKAPMIDRLIKEIEDQIANVIDKQVRAQVVESLKEHTSQALQDELENYRKQIETAQKKLYNSESCRENALLKRDQPHSIVRPLFRPNGQDASACFPKDLEALFSLDDGALKTLIEDYDLSSLLPTSPSRDARLNVFMRHIGVQYVMKGMLGGASLLVLIDRSQK